MDKKNVQIIRKFKSSNDPEKNYEGLLASQQIYLVNDWAMAA